MRNNDVLRRLRYIFDFSDQEMISLFEAGEKTVSRSDISDWLKRDDDETYKHGYFGLS